MGINNENYVLIQGWMVNNLKLKGNELVIYAIIYGFSQTENQLYTGSLQYLANWTNSTKQGVIKCLKSLQEKGLIGKKEKIINGVKFCEYYLTKFNGVLNKVEWGIKQSLIGGIKQSLPNNIVIDNIEDNIEDNITTTNNIYNYAEKNFGRPIAPAEYDKINCWLSLFNESIIKYAIDISVINGKRTFSYVDGILKNWKGCNYTNLQDIIDNEAKKGKSKDTPDWYKKVIKLEEATDEEKENIDKLLKEIGG